MEITLSPELEQIIQQRVETGRYQSATAVVEEALRLMEEREKGEGAYKTWVNAQIEEGLSELREGKGIDGEAVFAQLNASLDEFERDHKH